jgi:site-specific recombinase XerD
LRERGYDLEERQLLMGHESINTTQLYYGHLTIEDVAAKMSELGV